MKLKFSVSGNLDKYCIAPLILISLVENVIKHGILNDEDNPAVINISIENDELKLYTRNKIDRASENELVGIGLTNMKRRMELLYSGKHKLVIDDDNLFYKVNLSLQLL
jgi:LytS/YehU family sensor histidine kinase